MPASTTSPEGSPVRLPARRAPMRLLTALLAMALVLPVCAATAPAVRSFDGIVTHVGDGDSLWVRPASGGPPRSVRLQGIDAPEICQPHGVSAREALAARVLHRQVSLSTRGKDDYDRLLARVLLRGEDIGGWMVGQGHAWSYRRRGDAGPYATEQAQARRARAGLWAQPGAVEPRQFRQRGGCRQRD